MVERRVQRQGLSTALEPEEERWDEKASLSRGVPSAGPQVTDGLEAQARGTLGRLGRDAAPSGARSLRGPRAKSATTELTSARRILLGAAPVVGHRGARVGVPDEARDNERVESGA